jgi:hypothetical protein
MGKLRAKPQFAPDYEVYYGGISNLQVPFHVKCLKISITRALYLMLIRHSHMQNTWSMRCPSG